MKAQFIALLGLLVTVFAAYSGGNWILITPFSTLGVAIATTVAVHKRFFSED